MMKITGVEVLVYLLMCDMKDNEDKSMSVNTEHKNVHAEAMKIPA